MTEYRRIDGVELATAGMDWPASTGPVNITLEHLADAVTAANDDPLIVVPRVKLGHTSNLNGQLRVVSPFAALGDAAPVFGRFVNLRLENDGAVIVADAVEVPDWLGDSAFSSFPSRSIEADWDVTTEGGHRYSMVITAVSLLGEYGPAVRDLEDLERFLSDGPPVAAATASSTVEASVPASFSVDAATVRQRFNFDWATSDPVDGIDTYWWWARSIRVDPLEVIADDDNGSLWRVPVTTDGADEVTFAEPVRVRETYVDVDAPALAAATVADGQRVLASFSARPHKQHPSTTAATRHNQQEDSTMDVDTTILRRRLGLPEDATEDQITEALNAATEVQTEAEAVSTDVTHTEVVDSVSEQLPVAASADTVTVSRQVWEQSQSRLGALEQSDLDRRAAEDTARRDGIVAAAARDGRIAATEGQHYRRMLDIDEVNAAELIGSLAAGRIPPLARENVLAGSTSTVPASTGWFPQLQKEG